MKTFHLSLGVPDLDAAVAFYRELFGVPPAKERPGYAKFELADPPVALALQAGRAGGLSHLGIRVETPSEVEAAWQRLGRSGLATFHERDAACCYARQDKVWVADPGGHRWEVYTVLEDIEEEGPEAECCSAGACCAAG